MNFQEKLFLAGFGSGLLPMVPGTWGSAVGAVSGAAVLAYLPPETLFLLTILITLIAVKSINLYEARTGIHDDKRIVVDEIAGMWLTLVIGGHQVLAVALGFLFFRLYDIWKPSVIGRIDRDAPGGWGVMGDDIVAGAAAGLSTALVMEGLRRLGLNF